MVSPGSPFLFLFAMISGFFLFGKIRDVQSYINALKNKSRTLFVPYIVSSTLILLSMIVLNYVFSPKNRGQISFFIIARCVFAQPLSVQFWFLRDLIFLTVISPFILNNNRLYSYSFGSLLLLLWVQNIQPLPIIAGWYLINIDTLFFFWLGGILFRFNYILDLLIESSISVKLVSLFVWLSLICVRIYIDPDLNAWYAKNYTLESILLYKAAILAGIVCLIQFSALTRNNKALIYLSGCSFFAFLFHFVPLSHFLFFTSRIVNSSLSFYINFPVATIIVFFVAHITSSKFGKTYILITGGRNPNKALNRIK